MSLTQLDIDKVKRLRRRDYRLKTGLTIVEGYPEFSRAMKAKVEVQTLYLCPEIYQPQNGEFDSYSVKEITEKEFAKIAFGARLKGVLAICRPQVRTFSDLQLKSNPFLVVLEQIEKPGNVGTIIRSADGAGVDAIIVCDGKTDIYNHNIVRSSIGTVFHVPVVASTRQETFDFLKENKVTILAASAKNNFDYVQVDYKQSSAIILGNEHDGLSSFWIENADQCIKIPMLGQSTSLNVGVSATVLMYEALRQRNSKKDK